MRRTQLFDRSKIKTSKKYQRNFPISSVLSPLKLTSDEAKEQIFKLAKKGMTPSQIGVILRDSNGVAQVRFVTGNKILHILKTFVQQEWSIINTLEMIIAYT
mgnify:FL=1